MLEHMRACAHNTHVLLLELSQLVFDLARLKSTSRTEAQRSEIKLTLLLFTLQLQFICHPALPTPAHTHTKTVVANLRIGLGAGLWVI